MSASGTEKGDLLLNCPSQCHLLGQGAAHDKDGTGAPNADVEVETERKGGRNTFPVKSAITSGLPAITVPTEGTLISLLFTFLETEKHLLN